MISDLTYKDNAVVTVCTENYLYNALTALYTAYKYNKKCHYCLFFLGYNPPKFLYNIKKLTIYTLTDIEYIFKSFINKYGNPTEAKKTNYGDINHVLSFCSKPIIIKHLLYDYRKIILIDADLFFLNEWNFLFDKIDSVLLSPHFYSYNNPAHLHQQIAEYGYFNAGFIGASRKSIEFLNFWINLCYDKCEFNKKLGLFFEQKYLDTLYIMNDKNNFLGVNILNHYGCNIGPWSIGKRNSTLNVLIKNFKNNDIYIDQDLVIFIHLSWGLANKDIIDMREFEKNHDLFYYYANLYKKYKNFLKKKLNQ